ncbi:MAG: NHLP-related RiPP peptide [Stenotrophomonas rhizophila]
MLCSDDVFRAYFAADPPAALADHGMRNMAVQESTCSPDGQRP